MSQPTDKQRALFEKVEKLVSEDTAEKAVQSLDDAAMVSFLRDYYLEESLNYYDEVNKRTEEALVVVEKELEATSNPPYSPAFVEALVNVAKMSVMEEVVEVFNKASKVVREALAKTTITSPQAGHAYQMPLAEVMQRYSMLLSKELDGECKSRGLETNAFMQQAFQFIMADSSVIFEMDSFAGLKNYEAVKHVPVTKEQVTEFSKQTVAYARLLLEGKVHESGLMVYPSLMNQYLFLKFGIDSYQVMGKVVALLNEADSTPHLPLFRLLVEEIWYTENGRALIFGLLAQQMQYMEEMSKQGVNPMQMAQMAQMMGHGPEGGQDGQMDPALLEMLQKGGMPPMDPAMMEMLQKGGMPPMDPAMMEMLQKGGMPPVDPAMMEMLMKGGMPPMDPAMMEELAKRGMGGFDPSMMPNMEHANPETLRALEMGVAMGQKMRDEMTPEQQKALAEAFQAGDFAKMEELMPAPLREMLEKAKKEGEGAGPADK